MRSGTLSHSRRSGRPVCELITLIFLGLYAMRCAIVHEGGVALPRDDEIRVVRASARILKPALMRLLRQRLGVRIATGDVSFG